MYVVLIKLCYFNISGKVDEVVKKKLIFEKLLTIHPPILSEWFLQTFPDPSSW